MPPSGWTGRKGDVKKTILEIIRKEGIISRSQLYAHTGVRMATITEAVAELMADGVVVENSGLKNRRKSVSLNPLKYYAIGLDIHQKGITALLVDFKGSVRGRTFTSIRRGSSVSCKNLLEAVSESVEMIRKCPGGEQGDPIGDADILGIGVAIPAILDKDRQKVIISSQFKNLRDANLKELMENATGLPVFLEDCIILKLLAEVSFTAGKIPEDVVFIGMGESFGAAIMSKNIIFSGVSGIAGEIGHMTVDPDGSLCPCGKRGCLQSTSSFSAIIQKVRDGSGGAKQPDTGGLNVKTILEEAAGGKEPAACVVADAARYIGVAVANMVNLLNPGMIVFDKCIASENPFFMEKIIASIDKHTLRAARDAVEFRLASFEDGGALGGAAMILDKFFTKA